MTELLGYLPPKLRPLVAGALMAGILGSAVYAVAAFAAERTIAPVQKRVEQLEGYVVPLIEAVWSDSRALCAANPQAKCDGYTPRSPVVPVTREGERP